MLRAVITLRLATALCAAELFAATLGAAGLGVTSLAAQETHGADPALTRHLMPVPASVSFEPGQLAIDPSFTVAISRYQNGRLLRGVERAIQRLERRTGIDLPASSKSDTASARLVIEVLGAGQKVQSVAEDESYTIDITPERCTLRAATVVGALRGLETVLQLVESDSSGFHLPLAHIQDSPRFPWRGLLIDVSRHWQPVEVIERNLDAMALVKLNVFHWHLSDDQGFRVESRLHPELQRQGSDGHYYTQDDIRRVVAYARDRGIRVVPEFDMPGHATSWFVGYPRLASAKGPYVIERRFGVLDPAFDPTREEVYRFIDSFVGEMSQLFPDAYWHIGGDEVNGKQWSASTRIKGFMRRHGLKDNAALQAYFNQRLSRILRKHGKRMVGWDEIMHPGLPRNAVVQSWRGQKSLGEGARAGFRGILSAGYYLDAMESAATHYLVDPLPAGSGLDSTQASRILGGEVCMWGELITSESIDSRIWPRTAAIAERFWSPGSVTDIDDMYRRLDHVSEELDGVGLRHISGPQVGLRRIAGSSASDGTAPLRELMRLVEPLSLGQRARARRPTQTTPLTLPGDFVIPDASGRRALAMMVNAVLTDTSSSTTYADSLALEFTAWARLSAAVGKLRQRTPMVSGADSAAALLAALGIVGNEALSYLAHGTTPPSEWTTATAALLDRADAPVGLLRIAVVPAVRRLVDAAVAPTSADANAGRSVH